MDVDAWGDWLAPAEKDAVASIIEKLNAVSGMADDPRRAVAELSKRAAEAIEETVLIRLTPTGARP